MSDTFRQVDRKTLYLMPPSMNDWLPEGHLARFIIEIVGQLNLTAIKSAYAGRGSKAHHPEMLLALLFYGYATGVFSSRKLEQATYDSVAFRYIAAKKLTTSLAWEWRECWWPRGATSTVRSGWPNPTTGRPAS